MRIALPFLLGVALCSAAQASGRPVVAILAQNDGTEITDFLVPYGVIASSESAEVIAVSTHHDPVELVPGPVLAGTRIVADTSVAEFDRVHPNGAGFVV